jgi:CelD/BcsL family acetyltransferase involved in cellulose biosynthesis
LIDGVEWFAFQRTTFHKQVHIKIYNLFTSELEQTWKLFEVKAHASPFQCFFWLSHWYSTVGGPLLSVQPQIILIFERDELLAILPLGIRKAKGVEILEWMGGNQADYMGPLLHKAWNTLDIDIKECWLLMVKVISHYDVIDFKKQKQRIDTFSNPLVFLGCVINSMAYQAKLDISWEKYYNVKVKAKLRADSRRQRKRLKEVGELRFVYALNSASKQKIIHTMMRQKSRRYQETGAWDMLSVPGYKKFYEGLTDISNNNVGLHCSSLLVGNTCIATHVGLFDQTTFYYLMPAHEGGDWERFSPGRLLLEYLIEWSIQNGLKIFDFTIGDEQYKKNWCDTEIPLFETTTAVTYKGKMYVMAKQLKRQVMRLPWLDKQIQHLLVYMKNKHLKITSNTSS